MANDNCNTCYYFKDYRDCKTKFDKSYYEKGYCEYYKSFYYPDDSCNHYKDVNTYEPNSCYITTILCRLLGCSDDCNELDTLRKFRNNILQKDIKYKEILFEYDTVGPIISSNLYSEFASDEDKELPILLFNFYIQPTVKYIKEQKYEDAISRYKELTNMLMNYYNIDFNINENEFNNYDYQSGGHGYQKNLKI